MFAADFNVWNQSSDGRSSRRERVIPLKSNDLNQNIRENAAATLVISQHINQSKDQAFLAQGDHVFPVFTTALSTCSAIRGWSADSVALPKVFNGNQVI